MSEDEKNYIELEILQEEGLLEEGTNIMNLQALYDQDKQDGEIEEEPTKELENHMVIGEYYSE